MSYSSIKGLFLGYDTKTRGILANEGGFRNKVTTFTTGSTGTIIANHGTALITSISTGTWVLEAPAPGVRKVIMRNSTSTSTAAITIAPVSGNLQSTASSTYTTVASVQPGASLILEGQSTSRYTVISNNGWTLA